MFSRLSTLLRHEASDVSRLMQQVLLALVPGTGVLLWLYGWGMVSNLVLCIGLALGLEALLLKIRQRPLAPFLNDYSVVVTGWLLAVAMPAYSPWWLILIAMIFAVVIAKHLYGGLGYNPFNPAMVGYAAVLISYPVEMTRWASPHAFDFSTTGLTESLYRVFGTYTPAQWDASSGATPLDLVKTQTGLGQPLSEIYQLESFQTLASSGWTLVNIGFLLGGLWLLYKKVISWQIPTALLASMTLMATVFWLIQAEHYPSPLFHLFSGATMLAAFFIATDPVSASTTPAGRLLYAAGIGVFTYIIRSWGGYPDAIAFAVLIMNMAVPMLDHYTQPRVYGHGHEPRRPDGGGQ